MLLTIPLQHRHSPFFQHIFLAPTMPVIIDTNDFWEGFWEEKEAGDVGVALERLVPTVDKDEGAIFWFSLFRGWSFWIWDFDIWGWKLTFGHVSVIRIIPTFLLWI